MNRKKVIILAVVLLIILAVVALALKDKWLNELNLKDSISSLSSSSETTGGEVNLETNIEALNAMPGSPEAPKQVVVEENRVPEVAVKLAVSSEGFEPKEFKIKSGEKINLVLTGTDGKTHVFLFPYNSLMGLMLAVNNNESKMVTFTAPEPGVYEFRDDVPDFRTNTGKMIVE